MIKLSNADELTHLTISRGVAIQYSGWFIHCPDVHNIPLVCHHKCWELPDPHNLIHAHMIAFSGSAWAGSGNFLNMRKGTRKKSFTRRYRETPYGVLRWMGAVLGSVMELSLLHTFLKHSAQRVVLRVGTIITSLIDAPSSPHQWLKGR